MKAIIPRDGGAAAKAPRPSRGRLRAATTRCTPRAAPAVPVGLSCGIDVVDLGRFRRLVALRGGLFFAAVYTPRELADCADCLERLAARLATKEAVSKTLGCGIGPVGWRDVETYVGRDGRPRVRLHGRAARRARSLGLLSWALTLTYTRTFAAATVVACGDSLTTGMTTPERLGPWTS